MPWIWTEIVSINTALISHPEHMIQTPNLAIMSIKTVPIQPTKA
jgi:hypothetical protein